MGGGEIQVIPSHFNNLKRNCQKPLFIPFCWLHLEPWYTWIYIWIHETFEFIHEKIIWIHSLYDFILKSYMNSYMNSYIWTSEFIFTGIWIHIIIIWIHIWNDCMNSYTYELIYEMNIWIYEYMYSCILTQMYRFWILIWIHKYINSDILHEKNSCIQSEFINLIWIHYWK